MKIYLDSDFKCHVADAGNMVAVENDAFDGKCDTYIEGYRLVPTGSAWMREDGVVFRGEMIAPWKDWRELDAAQREYEQEQYQSLSADIAALDAEYQKGVDSL